MLLDFCCIGYNTLKILTEEKLMNIDKEYEELAEKKTASEEIFDGIVLHVFKDTVELPNGNSAIREVSRHIGAVCIVAVTDDDNIVLERQFRYPIDKVFTEIPAGKLDFPDEDRLSAAKRELEEETGYVADTWTDMGLYFPAIAYCDEKITMFLATGLKKGERHLDADEFLNVFLQPLEETVQDILDGKITDGKTQAAVLKAAMLLKNKTR